MNFFVPSSTREVYAYENQKKQSVPEKITMELGIAA